jgi:hypothetical protein
LSVLLSLFLLQRALALGWGGRLLFVVIVIVLVIVLLSGTFAGCGCGLGGGTVGTVRSTVAGSAVGRPGLLAKLLIMLTTRY